MRPDAGSTGVGQGGRKPFAPSASPGSTQTPTPTGTRKPNPASSDPRAALGLPPAPAGSPAAATTWVANQTAYKYPTWAALDQRTRDLYNDIAKAYNVNSTGKAWYRDDFLPYVRQILEETGIAPDPENVALTFARQAGYDVSDYLESSPVLSPNSILFDTPMGDLTGEPGTGSSSGGSGSYSGGGGGYGGGGGGGGGSVSLTNPTTARGLLLQTMQGVLGRNPSEQEYKQFIKALSQAEMDAPRTVKLEGDLAVQSGGVDPGMVAMEYVEGLDEFNSAAGQRTLDAFMQVLGA